MQRIILIACVKEKRTVACAAKALYQGELFASWLEYVQKEQADQWFILSGKHGLLLPDEVIAPYDVNLNTQPESVQKAWAKHVLHRLDQYCDLEQDEFHIICNPTYYRDLVPHIKHHHIPFVVE